MRRLTHYLIIFSLMASSSSIFANQKTSVNPGSTENSDSSFKYLIEQFADLKIMRYQVPGFEQLSLKQKELLYYLSQAALFGRDITFDQNYKHNLCIRRTLEQIYLNYNGDRSTKEFQAYLVYLKRVWFSNGIHHHYSTEKFEPGFSKEYFKELVANSKNASWPLNKDESRDQLVNRLSVILFDPKVDGKRIDQKAGQDMVTSSANNFYEGVTQKEVEEYYSSKVDKNDQTPVSYGINSKVIKKEGKVAESIWKVGGMYGPAIEKIVFWLQKAVNVAEDESQKASILKLIEYYQTGDLAVWDEYNVLWVSDLTASVDFVNGFIENYGDPMSMKATWEALVNFKDMEATIRTEKISNNAKWFEDNSPIDPRFRKKEIKGVSAKVINAVQLGGDCYPSTPIGINLPNADWIRRDHGSKSVTIGNISHAYEMASLGSGFLEEFSYSDEEVQLVKKYGAVSGNLHTDLHECLGHGSGQLLPGVSTEVLKNYQATLEEARADLFALYYLMDPKMIELGLITTLDVAKAEYISYISNALMKQLTRIVPGNNVEQAHMRCRMLIGQWCYEKGQDQKVIVKEVKDDKTYFVIKDFEKLRKLFGELLMEIQRIKSEGDYQSGMELVEKYAIKVDPVLHKEVLQRFEKLNVAPYGGFINPVLSPVFEKDEIIDIRIEYPDDYTKQMFEYSTKYSPLPAYN